MAPHEQESSSLQLSDCGTDQQGEYEVPQGYGLLIRLHSLEGTVTLESVPDCHYTEIHPNCYAPADMDDVRLLHGGGSGTAVFHGENTSLSLGSIVMKHGGAKDTAEVFSLAGISQELLERSKTLSPEAADAMRSRIPEFTMLYLSPYHLRDRASELWASLRGAFWRNKAAASNTGVIHAWFKNSSSGRQQRKLSVGESSRTAESTRHIYQMSRGSIARLSPHARVATETGRTGMRKIRVCLTQDVDAVRIDICLTTVIIYIPNHFFIEGQDSFTINAGIEFLKELQEELVDCQKEESWKVTLAQKTIGGDNPQNGAHVLTNYQLRDAKLRLQLVQQFVDVMKDLSKLTLPEESSSVVDMVREEVERLKITQDVSSVSKMADAFVGSAIVKNFHPVKGRFPKMRAFGDRFRSNETNLFPEEIFPSECLGLLLQQGNSMATVFEQPPSDDDSTLDRIESVWLQLLEEAVSLPPYATNCVWTCGLTDAGLHNTFLSEERGLELFDLGRPCKMPRPAFLTKFLMSFFHTAGMEEGPDGQWVHRFFVVDDKLALTAKTRELIPYLDETFHYVVTRLVQELFEGDENVRRLLIKYVILQLLSDGAFCLDRWEQKGGGAERTSGASRRLEKWLWRCLWDIYIAAHVYHKFLKERA